MSEPRAGASAHLVERLSSLDSCSVSDALDQLGIAGAVTGLSPLTVGRRVAGPAVTVKLGAPLAGAPRRHLGAGAVMSARPGDIVVVEHGGRTDVSGWGGLLSRGAKLKGVAAVIVDGACRDIDEGREMDLPVYARAAVPVTARGRIAEHAFNERVTIGRVAVEPGDLVLADGSGVVFIPRSRAEAVISAAERIQAREQLMAEAIDRGDPLGDVMGADYEDMLKTTAAEAAA